MTLGIVHQGKQSGVLGYDKSPLPSERSIRAYWASVFTAEELWRKSFDSPNEFMEEWICFACGHCDFKPERAHIIPRSKYGLNTVENLHMLCPLCHEDSEGLSTLDRYWKWFWDRTMQDTWVSIAWRQGIDRKLIGEFLCSIPRPTPVWNHVPATKPKPDLIAYNYELWKPNR